MTLLQFWIKQKDTCPVLSEKAPSPDNLQTRTGIFGNGKCQK